MNKLCGFALSAGIILCLLTGCSRAIEIDIARQSSDINHCEIIFGTDLNTLKYENAILLQTGFIDTTNEQAPIPIAIVIIAKKEIILKLIRSNEVGNETRRLYENEDYKLNLTYKKQVEEHNEIIYKGNFSIENKGLKSEYNVTGCTCNL
ncbi:hypothetical protein [Ferruginibacter sp. SUN106]|uniref:hypothetical protein n=1 Tax=Ferruginibacter sp. SUN106 TaxID=2978348 RepID=UPI003D36A03D